MTVYHFVTNHSKQHLVHTSKKLHAKSVLLFFDSTRDMPISLLSTTMDSAFINTEPLIYQFLTKVEIMMKL